MNISEVSNVLKYIDPNIGRDDWAKVAMGLKSEFGEDAIDIFDEWSERGDSYNIDDMASTWNSISSDGGVTMGTVVHMAKENGYKSSLKKSKSDITLSSSKITRVTKMNDKGEKLQNQKDAAEKANAIWKNAGKLNPKSPHQYLVSKGIDTIVTDQVRQNEDILLVPISGADGNICNLERIFPNGDKRGLKGGKRKSAFTLIKGKNKGYVITEGFATAISIHAATDINTVISYGKSNLQAIAEMVRSELPDSKIIIAGDVGSEDSATKAARAVNGYIAIPDLPQNGADFNDLHQSKGLDAVKVSIESCKKALQWDAIEPLNTALPEVKKLNYDTLPSGLSDWVKDISERMHCPPDFVAVGAMFSASVLLGNKIGIHPKSKDNWLVIPNLWGAVIGRPSAKKSPAIDNATKPLIKLTNEARKEYEDLLIQHDVDIIEQTTQKKILEDHLKNAIKNGTPDEIEDSKQDLFSFSGNIQQPPTEKRFIVNDATVEKLGELLNQNTNGLGLQRDELIGWLKSLDREDKSNDRAFYLESFNGNGSFTYDRIGRGTIHIERNTVSIFGGIQPAKLQPYIWNAINQNSNDDGLIQRLQLLVYPDENKNWVNVDRTPDKNAQDTANEIYRKLNDIPPVRDDSNNVIGVHFDDDAQQLFNVWYEQNEKKIREPDIHPAIASHLGKYGSLCASLALIINEIEQEHNTTIVKQSMVKALGWITYLESHAMRMYSNVVSPVIHIADMILTKKDKLPDGFTRRDIMRKHWSGISNKNLVGEALNELIECNYLKSKSSNSTGGGGSCTIKYRWNPDL